MAGGHSVQKNKAHKRGRHAGPSARTSAKQGKVDAKATPTAALARKGKEARMQQAAHARSKSRNDAVERRRYLAAPVVVQLLCTSAQLDSQPVWDTLLSACSIGSDAKSLKDFDEAQESADGMQEACESHACKPTTLAIPGRNKLRVTLLPPPSEAARGDPRATVEVAKTADVVLLCVPVDTAEKEAGKGLGAAAALDAHGRLALQVLRSMGMPQVLVVTRGLNGGVKERALAKKAAAAALEAELPGDLKISPLDSTADCVRLLRHLSETRLEPPVWRRSRPHLLLEGATCDAPVATEGATCRLHVDAYVRGVPLSPNQLVTVPGAGDFAIESIRAAPELVPVQGSGSGAGVAGHHDTAELPVLAEPNERREVPQLENEAEAMEEEQTWPDADEIAQAQAETRAHLAPGTSDYQACWILDDDEHERPASHERDDAPAAAAGSGDAEMAAGESAAAVEDDDDADMATEADGGEAASAEEVRELRRRRRRQAEEEDLLYPDEVDTPHETPARERFQKYRGLKSFRTSAWSAREGLPREYTRIFAFEDLARAKKLALQAARQAAQGALPDYVPCGTYVRVTLAGVPAAAAHAVCGAVSAHLLGAAPPVAAFGLLKHENKLSVVNMTVTRTAAYDAPIANKERLSFVTGLRRFTANPVISSDDYNADKHKLERFMHGDRPYVMSAYAPISFPPLPALVLKEVEGAPPQLVATGHLLSPDPDRIVLKKIVLSGYPTKVQKKKAVVKYMFFNPEDVRWFKPLDVFTKYGRRGRIKEPLGTHGHMKCVFDAPVQQRDSVCIALYKRAFPKWPESLQFS